VAHQPLAAIICLEFGVPAEQFRHPTSTVYTKQTGAHHAKIRWGIQ
jgi:hypothetical protein